MRQEVDKLFADNIESIIGKVFLISKNYSFSFFFFEFTIYSNVELFLNLKSKMRITYQF